MRVGVFQGPDEIILCAIDNNDNPVNDCPTLFGEKGNRRIGEDSEDYYLAAVLDEPDNVIAIELSQPTINSI